MGVAIASGNFILTQIPAAKTVSNSVIITLMKNEKSMESFKYLTANYILVKAIKPCVKVMAIAAPYAPNLV